MVDSANCYSLAQMSAPSIQNKTNKPMYSKENLAKINKLNALAPDAMKAYWAFDKLSVADGASEFDTGGFQKIAGEDTKSSPAICQARSFGATIHSSLNQLGVRMLRPRPQTFAWSTSIRALAFTHVARLRPATLSF
jgi:hypothetical protein